MWSHVASGAFACDLGATPVAETIVDEEPREAPATPGPIDVSEPPIIGTVPIGVAEYASIVASKPVTLKRPALERPTVAERPQGQPTRRKAKQPKATPEPEQPEEPAPAIQVDPSDDPIHVVSPEDAPYLQPGKPLAPLPDAAMATCDVCGRAIPARLLAMHRANCERAAKGLT